MGRFRCTLRIFNKRSNGVARLARCSKNECGRGFWQTQEKVAFLYDYGEEWHFVVQNTETKVSDADTEYPEIVKSYAKAPSQYDDDEDDEVKEKKEVKRITNSNGRYIQTTLKF